MYKRKYDGLIDKDSEKKRNGSIVKKSKTDKGRIHPFFSDSKSSSKAESKPPFLPRGKEYTANGGEILLKLRDGSPALVRHKPLSKGMANELYLHLRNKAAIEFTQKTAPKFQFKKVKPPMEPRLTAGFTADPTKKFRYSDQIVTGVPFTEPIQNLVDHLHTNCATPGCVPSNFIFGNQYDDVDVDVMEDELFDLNTQHHMSEHSDDDTSTNVCQPVWSVSLGTPRVLQIMVARKVAKAEFAKQTKQAKAKIKKNGRDIAKEKETAKHGKQDDKLTESKRTKAEEISKPETIAKPKQTFITSGHSSFARELSIANEFIVNLVQNVEKPLFIPKQKLYNDYLKWRATRHFIIYNSRLYLSDEDFEIKAVEYLFQSQGNYYFYQSSIQLHSSLPSFKKDLVQQLKPKTDSLRIKKTNKMEEQKKLKQTTAKMPRRKCVLQIVLRHGDILTMYGRPTPEQDGMQQIYSHMVLVPTPIEMIKWKREDCRFSCRFNLTARSLR